jgi:hypothetical protein
VLVLFLLLLRLVLLVLFLPLLLLSLLQLHLLKQRLRLLTCQSPSFRNQSRLCRCLLPLAS